MKSTNVKSNVKYPNYLDACSVIFGSALFLLGAAGVLFMLGYNHGARIAFSRDTEIFSNCSYALGVLLTSSAMIRYNRAHDVEYGKNIFMLRRIAYENGKYAFYPTNLRACAQVLKLDPSFVILALYKVLPAFATIAFVLGLIAHQSS